MITLDNGINKVSMQRITFGPNNYDNEDEIDKYFNLLDMYFDAGGRSIDTARVYANGLTEEIIGRWMKKRNNREKLVITTKGGHPPIGDMYCPRLDRESIIFDIKASLSALGTDYVDVYLLHRDARNLPISDIVDTLDEIVKMGYAKVCGVSNWKTDRINEANEYAKRHNKAKICVSQINFSLAETTPERLNDDTLVCMTDEEYEYYLKNNIPVMAFSSQAKGFFAKLGQGAELSQKAKDRFLCEKNLKRFERVKEISQKYKISPTAVALAYLSCNPLPVSAVFSCRTKEQMADTLTALKMEITENEVNFLKG